MKRLNLSRNVPILGVLAFSLCSVWSLYNLFVDHAKDDSQVFWLAAVLVEIVTAWIVFQTVNQAHHVTRSNVTKQDRRFHTAVMLTFVVLAVPTLSASIIANYAEFSSWLLAVLFPAGAIACAIGAALPVAVSNYERRKEVARKQQEVMRKERATAKEVARRRAELQQEASRKKQEEARKKQEADRKTKEVRDAQIRNLGAAGRVLEVYQERPEATQAEVAEALGITDRAVRYHLNSLEEVGLVKKNGHGLEVVA